MYKIFADDLCFYSDDNPEDSFKLISPKLKLSDNSAGSLTFTLPPCNIAYKDKDGHDIIKPLSTYIYVYRDDEEIWSGRVISEQKDFWNNRTLTCEGRLAFLNDTVQPKWTYTANPRSLSGFLQHLLDIHNQKVDAERRISLGYVSSSQNLSGKWLDIISAESSDSDLVSTDYETTFDCVKKKLVEQIGGHIRVVKKINASGYQMDYLADTNDGSVDSINTSNQSIEFGNNLFDYVKDSDMTSLVTVVIPLGARLKDSEGKETDNRLMIDSVYIEAAANIISEYGRIEKAVIFDGVTNKTKLETLGSEYLKSALFDNVKLEIKAVDLHYLNPSIDAFNLFDSVYCVSEVHGLGNDKAFVITQIDIPLDDPASTTYSLGRCEKRSMSNITSTSNSNNETRVTNAAQEAIDYANSILTLARNNAASLMDARSKGYVTFKMDSQNKPEAIYVSDNQDYTRANRYWLWNMNGLAYYNRDNDPPLKTAWTMDGGFCADFITTGAINASLITTGTMSADRIYGGSLTSKNYKVNSKGSKLYLDSGMFYAYHGDYGTSMGTGAFRLLWQGDENGGLGALPNGEPRLFYPESKAFHIGYGRDDGTAVDDSITLSPSRIEFRAESDIKFVVDLNHIATIDSDGLKDRYGQLYATESWVTDKNYATESWVTSQGYLYELPSHTHTVQEITQLQTYLNSKMDVQPTSISGALHSIYFDRTYRDANGLGNSYIAGTTNKGSLHLHDDRDMYFTVGSGARYGFCLSQRVSSAGGEVNGAVITPPSTGRCLDIGNSSDYWIHSIYNEHQYYKADGYANIAAYPFLQSSSAINIVNSIIMRRNDRRTDTYYVDFFIELDGRYVSLREALKAVSNHGIDIYKQSPWMPS